MSDRLEDVIRGCVRQFASTSDFTTFAQSVNGLSLSMQDVTTIIENHRFSVEEQKKKLFWLWVERNGPNATVQGIRNLVTQYYAAEQQGAAAPIDRLEDVFQDVVKRFTSKEFKQFARSGQGLSLREHEIDEVMEDYKYTRERNLKLLWKWRHSKCPNTDDAAVIERIRQVVDEYIHGENQAEEEQIIDDNNQAENEQLCQSRMPVVSISEISKSLSESTSSTQSSSSVRRKQMPQTSTGVMGDTKNIREFLTIVEDYSKQMLESRLRTAKEKTKTDDFILPKVTEFEESEPNKQTSLQSVDITKIHSDNSVNRVMLLGDTGSGKTTFSMRYALSALENKLNFSNKIKMVYFVEVSNLQGDSQSTAFDLLFVQQLGSKLPEHLHHVGQKWLKQNSKHILLVVDGLDQSQKPFASEYRRIGVDTLAETNTILANILSDHIYPGMKILSTTRWNVYWKLPPNLKATLNLTLGGWDDETLKVLAGKLFSPEARKLLVDMRRKAPELVSNPMFFFYLVRVLEDSQKSDVDTLTNLMVSVLKCFSGSRHGGSVKRLVSKLMKLAFHGMRENLFVFTASYIRSLNLDINDMYGLVEMDADTRFVEYVADDDDIRIRFSHQSIQEVLGALYVCTLDLNEFKKFIEDKYEKPGMEVVMKHIFGIILNKSTSEKAAKYLSDNLSSLYIKFEYLMGYLEDLLKGKVISDQLVVTLLHECGPDVIKKVCSRIKEMNLGYQKIHSGDQHAVMSVAKHSPSLRTLEQGNLVIHPENYYYLQHLLGSVQDIYVEIFYLINCDPDAKNLRILKKAIIKGNLRIGCLLTGESPALEPLGYYYLIGLVYHGGAERLILRGCDLNAEKISKMNAAVIKYGMKLHSLAIAQNPNMIAEAFQQLAKFLKYTEGKNLQARNCTPTSEQLSAFCSSLENEDVKLSELHLERSTAESYTDDELMMVSRLVERVRELEFYSQELDKQQIAILTKETKKYCSRAKIECESWGFRIENQISD